LKVMPAARTFPLEPVMEFLRELSVPRAIQTVPESANAFSFGAPRSSETELAKFSLSSGSATAIPQLQLQPFSFLAKL
jgi:hypothetical protein